MRASIAADKKAMLRRRSLPLFIIKFLYGFTSPSAALQRAPPAARCRSRATARHVVYIIRSLARSAIGSRSILIPPPCPPSTARSTRKSLKLLSNFSVNSCVLSFFWRGLPFASSRCFFFLLPFTYPRYSRSDHVVHKAINEHARGKHS